MFRFQQTRQFVQMERSGHRVFHHAQRLVAQEMKFALLQLCHVSAGVSALLDSQKVLTVPVSMKHYVLVIIMEKSTGRERKYQRIATHGLYYSCYCCSQGRIQAIFEIGNRFWALKNRRPNFDRSTKNIILILSHSC